MQNLFRLNSRFIFRAVLLFGVFPGLLFSCGEGIRLVPFPAAENAERANFEWKTNQANSYQKNVHRFETRLEAQSKFQRKSPPHPFTGVFESTNNFQFVAAASSCENRQLFVFQTIRTIKIAESVGKRAPPVSEFL